MESLYDQFGQLVQNVFGEAPAMPAVADVEETEDSYIVDLDLPGVKKEDLNVEVAENRLRVSGELKQKEHAGVMRRQNRRIGQFDHMIALPGEMDPDQVRATLHDGVLTIQLGKASRTVPHKVEIREN
jgi:HSP20 family protein